MNYVDCEDGFGNKYIGQAGERVRLTNVGTRVVLEGVLSERVSKTHRNVSIKLDGTTMKNIFRQSEWEVEILPEVIEDGVYQDTLNLMIYRVRGGGEKIVYTNMYEGDQVERSSKRRKDFAKMVASGTMKKISAS